MTPPEIALRSGKGDDPTTWLPRRLQALSPIDGRREQRIRCLANSLNALRFAYGGANQVVG